MWNFRHRLLVLLASTTVLVCGGCGSDYPETAQVQGKITFKEAPVVTGRIIFYPTSGARLSSGEIKSDGSYALTTFNPNDGALLGKHRVTITSTKVLGPSAPTSVQDEAKQTVPSESRVVWLVDKKYSEQSTTDLEVEVKSGDNRIDFALPIATATGSR